MTTKIIVIVAASVVAVAFMFIMGRFAVNTCQRI